MQLNEKDKNITNDKNTKTCSQSFTRAKNCDYLAQKLTCMMRITSLICRVQAKFWASQHGFWS